MKKIIVDVKIKSKLEDVWRYWSDSSFIPYWNFATEEWWVKDIEQEFRENGHFSIRMEARDQSAGFDFSGYYRSIDNHKQVVYELEDKRLVTTTFSKTDDSVKVTQEFDPDSDVPFEQQEAGWQLILNRFKDYCESDIKPYDFKFSLNCDAKTLWSYITDLDLYKKWSSVFFEGAYFIGDWSENSEMEFLDKDEYGTRALVLVNKPEEELLMRHIALIDKKHPKRTFSRQSRMWIGLIEGYYITTYDDHVDFTLHVEGHEELIPIIINAWKNAASELSRLIDEKTR